MFRFRIKFRLNIWVFYIGVLFLISTFLFSKIPWPEGTVLEKNIDFSNRIIRDSQKGIIKLAQELEDEGITPKIWGSFGVGPR